jgi:hypothetical protein
VPEGTLTFWIIKMAATTLGETGGDTVTTTLNWGYMAGTALFFVVLALLVAAQIRARAFHPFLYWATIVASTTFGTTMADFADRSLGIGYTGGSTLLLCCLAVVLALWYRLEGSISVNTVTTPCVEAFYWGAITFPGPPTLLLREATPGRMCSIFNDLSCHHGSTGVIFQDSKEIGMRVELVVGATNVVRFPVERRARPTMELLRQIAPDVREVLLLVESFGLSLPDADPRTAADAEMAAHIANNVRPEPGALRKVELDGLLAPFMAEAVAVCRMAHDAAQSATEAQEHVVDAKVQGGYWIEALEARAEELTALAARRLVEAHVRSEQAEGANRAVCLAQRGEAWRPFTLEAEAEALFFGGRKTA